ncbi:putative methyltransferase DDB_G0268948 [Corythoichthys intestinalis]|uniref:putative methyltransferase DDB_G0268948 n=1 Tax=Corythoichthys intestinalis TaxID=161448 RepID=UPI0025A5739B|nr:putative methyltransferase DDB_G0268948 [Corythoichthys intestinalis]XP_061799455.1 putative methyltransferase DDB_G0268948 [Nerophis lumbriciformis]
MAHRMFEGKEHAASYWKYRISHSDHLIQHVINFVQKQRTGPLSVALDVGCGSGQGTVLLAKHFESVVGTDVSPAQLEVAMQHAKEPNVTYRQCVAEELPFADSSVDLITAMLAFHWFDRPRFLQEVYRVLKPRGCVALLNYTIDMELEYPDCSLDSLNQVCKEFYAALIPYRNPCLGPRSIDLYREAYNSIPYTEKEWNEGVWVKRPMPLCSYIGMVESFSSYQAMLKKDPQATKLSQDICERLMSIMKVTSAETEVVVGFKYHYVLASKNGPNDM